MLSCVEASSLARVKRETCSIIPLAGIQPLLSIIDLIRIELLYNLAILIAVTVLSGMAGRRWEGRHRGGFSQGLLFGGAAVISMMTPMPFVAGIQFDARSVAISVCGAYFGPVAALTAGGMAAVYRIVLGGAGAPTGVFVVLAATVWGVLFHYGLRTARGRDTLLRLWVMGLTLHVVMLALMFTLPGGVAWEVLRQIAPSVMIFFPLATVLLGVILSDQRARREDMQRLRESEDRFQLFLEGAPAAIAMLDTRMCYLAASNRWYSDYGIIDQDIIGRSHYEIFPEIGDSWKAIHQRCLAGESAAREEDAFERADGRTDWLRWAIKPWRLATGEVGGIIMFTEVITERKEAALSLVAANQLLESTFESLSDAVLVIETPSRTVVRCNAAVQQVFGHPPESLLGRNTQLLYENDAAYAAVGRAARSAMEQGRIYREEVVLCRADGTRIDAEMTVSAIRHDRDWRTGVVSVIRDISARKESDRALSRMAERQTAILESITDAFCTLDHEWRFTYLNSEAERHLLRSKDALIGRVAGEVFSEAAGGDIKLHLARAMNEQVTVHFETYYAPFEQWFEVHAYPSEEGLAVYFRDISERVRAEKELREVSKRLQDVLDFSPLLITEIDTEGRYLLANAAAAELLNRDAKDVIGRRIHEFLPGDAGRFMERLDAVRRGGAPLVIEDTLYVPEARTYTTTLFPMMDDAGQVVSIGGIAQDITDQKAAEAERTRMESQLLQAQRMEAVGRLAGGVAHDFNNMLSVILGHTEMALLALPQDDFLRRELEEIQQAATRSADLTRQLLAFARRQAIAPRALDLNEAIEKLMSMLSRLVGENIVVDWRPGATLPQILADPTQIDQILANLTVNARDAIVGNGQMRIETAAASFDVAYCAHNPDHVPGDYAMLAVTDDGCGMDEATLSQVFEPFFTTKAIGGGTGLGLATVYGIVQQNKGFLTVRSAPGRGSTFRIYLPAHTEGQASPSPASDRSSAPHGAETVLLVEDEAALLNLSRRVLERLGYTVLAAAAPREALALATSHEGEIHLLITDVIMPEMNGRELWKQLVALLPGLRTLFISGYTADIIGRQGAIDGEVHFLQKPFKIDQLATRVREILDGAAPAPPP